MPPVVHYVDSCLLSAYQTLLYHNTFVYSCCYHQRRYGSCIEHHLLPCVDIVQIMIRQLSFTSSNKSKRHGSGCTTTLSRMYSYLEQFAMSKTAHINVHIYHYCTQKTMVSMFIILVWLIAIKLETC